MACWLFDLSQQSLMTIYYDECLKLVNFCSLNFIPKYFLWISFTHFIPPLLFWDVPFTASSFIWVVVQCQHICLKFLDIHKISLGLLKSAKFWPFIWTCFKNKYSLRITARAAIHPEFHRRSKESSVKNDVLVEFSKSGEKCLTKRMHMVAHIGVLI